MLIPKNKHNTERKRYSVIWYEKIRKDRKYSPQGERDFSDIGKGQDGLMHRKEYWQNIPKLWVHIPFPAASFFRKSILQILLHAHKWHMYKSSYWGSPCNSNYWNHLNCTLPGIGRWMLHLPLELLRLWIATRLISVDGIKRSPGCIGKYIACHPFEKGKIKIHMYMYKA